MSTADLGRTRRRVPIDPAILSGAVHTVAPRVLGTLVEVEGGRCGRVVEVEAYDGADDPASHAYRGRTSRNASMFGPAGSLYVYRSYGLHWCANVVLGVPGRAAAVLLRAVEPVEGLEQMRAARPTARRDVDLTNGPGKLCAALGITGADDGTDLLDPSSRVRLCTDGTAPPVPLVTTRVGISTAVDRAWRFVDPASAWVSKGRPSGG